MIRFISVFSGTALLLMVPFNAEAACTFLQPVGGGEKIVKKKVERPKGLVGKAVGRTNWNTDFVVDRPLQKLQAFLHRRLNGLHQLSDSGLAQIQRRQQPQGG